MSDSVTPPYAGQDAPPVTGGGVIPGKNELKHIVINEAPYLVEEIVWEWTMALSKENQQMAERCRELEELTDNVITAWRDYLPALGGMPEGNFYKAMHAVAQLRAKERD